MTGDTPTFFPTPQAESFFGLAREVADLCEAGAETLSYADYTELLSLEASLLAYANVLSVLDRATFLANVFQDAQDILTAIRDIARSRPR